MKTKRYAGNTSARSYCKGTGSGAEVGFVFGGKPVFTGNFHNKGDANRFYGQLNREIRSFNKRFKVAKNCPKNWYGSFIGAYLNRLYFKHLSAISNKGNRQFNTAVNKNVRKYKKLSRRWTGKQKKQPFLRAA